jgi:hypothetical protein
MEDRMPTKTKPTDAAQDRGLKIYRWYRQQGWSTAEIMARAKEMVADTELGVGKRAAWQVVLTAAKKGA